jgi:predicted RNA-binding Zn-ribbon protein involved in translation (DUF1610 family)
MLAKTEPRKMAPSYFECPACGLLSDDPAFAGPGMPCPECGATSVDRRPFPTTRLRRLDSRIRHYHEEQEHEIIVILVAAFLEAALEDIIDRMLIAQGARLPLRRLVLDSERGIGGRLSRVFPALTTGSFDTVAEDLGFESFAGEWRAMRSARNAFIHDSPFQGPQETLDAGLAHEAMILLDQAYLLFELINNTFVAGEHATEDPLTPDREGA